MRTLGTRRVALLASAAAVAVALAGCSAGQVAETSLKRPSNQGVNTQNNTGSVVIRNLAVSYNGPAGYQPGTDAPLELGLYNQTRGEITVRVSSAAPQQAGAPTEGVVVASAVSLVGGTASSSAEPSASADPSSSADPSASPEPSASADDKPAAGAAAEIKLAPMGSVTFLPGDSETLEAIGLNGKLVPGNQISLVFSFSDGSADVPVLASVATPLTPAPRGSGLPDENSEE